MPKNEVNWTQYTAPYMLHRTVRFYKVNHMSGASSTLHETDAAGLSVRGVGTDLVRTALTTVQFFAFWAAVLLPFYALWILYGGLSGGELATLVHLLPCNLVCFVVGHDYSC